MKLSFNENIAGLVQSKTGERVRMDTSRPIGLADGVPLMFEYDLSQISRQPILPPYINGLEPGMWRYAPLLPIHGVSESFADDVGQTPTVLHEALSAELGVEVYLKNEGGNPSGSFKDRGLCVGIALGVACGAKRFCLPTQGNAGVAAALFSARAGIEPALVYMPAQHDGSIYHRAAVGYGAEVRFHGDNIAAAGKEMRKVVGADLASGALVDISTFYEPGRLEGKKTMGFEIVEAFGQSKLPSHIFYPTGGGTGLVGIWKAFQELRGLGVLPRDGVLPQLIAVQSEQCCPVVRSFEAGADTVSPVVSKGTCADGLDVPGAIMGHSILRALRDSKGGAVAVSEQSIIDAFAYLGRAGVSASYEGAATLAGLRASREAGRVPDGARVLLLITASALLALSARPKTA